MKIGYLRCLAVSAVLLACSPAFGEDVMDQSVGFVYQLSDPHSFDFQVPGRVSDCGSDLYRVREDNVDVVNRKFNLVVSAFMGGKHIAFSAPETGSCAGSRKVVSWIRLVP